MKLTTFAIKQIASIVTGDAFSPKRTGSKLVDLFNEYGCRDVYDFNNGGLPVDPASKSGQHFSRTKYVENRLVLLDQNNLRLLLEKILTEAEDKAAVANAMNNVISPEGYTASISVDTYVILGGVVDRTPPVRNEAHFQLIQNQILNELDRARVSIWVAVAWFTNETLFNKLLQKQTEGLDVRLAIYDDGVNRVHGVDFRQISSYTPLRGQRSGLMHNKFCVIDNQVVITGSYNWTINAETRNDENVSILRDPSRATEYSEAFRQLTTL